MKRIKTGNVPARLAGEEGKRHVGPPKDSFAEELDALVGAIPHVNTERKQTNALSKRT
jgi:hypothetical protein